MKRNISLFVIVLVLMPALAWAAVVADTHFNATSEGGWNCYAYPGELLPESVTVSGTPDLSKALKINYRNGFRDGNSPIWCSSPHYNSDEFYFSVYVYFPADYEWHPTIQKLAYSYLLPVGGDNPGNIILGISGTSRKIVFGSQPSGISKDDGAINNTYYGGTVIRSDTWYKLTYYGKLNKSGVSNGILKAWINDVLEINVSNMNMRGGTHGTRNWYSTTIMPIWGGIKVIYKDGADYFYMDRAIVSTTPIGGVSKDAFPDDSLKEPSPPNSIIIK